ncbi:MAG: iron ABC transporter permease [Anaerohalosphaeraceae bacterium]|nr:iron ABC transporter permease [Anaerohalosphaeraceae bacterium]
MKKDRVLILIFLLAIFAFFALPFVGSTSVSVSAIKDFRLETVQGRIFYQIRLPRTCVAFLAGAALSCCGMALQAMFKNPLATPFTLGISSGAALGTAIYIISALPAAIMGFSVITISSFAGAIGACLLVYGLTRAAKGFSVATMLLAGVVVNFFFSSIILFLQYHSNFTESFRIIHWLMGSIEVAGFKTVFNMFIFVAGGAVIIWRLRGELNLLTISDEIAITRGVNLQRVRKTLFLATSIMVAGVVSFCGPIGFVGLIAPHICRLLVGADHKRLAPASMLFGAAFLGVCDTIARTIMAPIEIPVGVITALLGGPFFVWLLLKGSSEKSLL